MTILGGTIGLPIEYPTRTIVIPIRVKVGLFNVKQVNDDKYSYYRLGKRSKAYFGFIIPYDYFADGKIGTAYPYSHPQSEVEFEVWTSSLGIKAGESLNGFIKERKDSKKPKLYEIIFTYTAKVQQLS